MDKRKLKNFSFENSVLKFESFINDFTEDLYNEFDSKSKELNLRSKIDDLINGGIVNETEKQAAWHPRYKKRETNLNNHLSKLINKINKNNKNRKINIIIIGIGGSYEGPKLLIESINSLEINNSFNFQFLTGPDLTEFVSKTSLLDPNGTIFIVASKSFTTDETILMLTKAMEWSSNKDNFIAITANSDEAKKYGINEKNIITFDKEIGGRYSIWSPIAELPIIEKIQYKSFLEGGKIAESALIEDAKYLNFIKRLSFLDIWNNNLKNKNTRVILSYIWLFRSLPDYFQQLEMESLGKPPNIKSDYHNTGQIIFGGYGPKAQHSYFQLLHQGSQKVCADIIASKSDNKNLAYAQAVTQSSLLSNGAKDLKENEEINGNISVNLFILNKVDAFTLGFLITLWEHRTFVSSVMLGINPFDQFGVSAGKVYTKRYFNNKIQS
tara:strand:- start:115 stop:1434 length:1320 start_codon:yes stop_codon:yes gene_type:complete